MTAEQIKAAIEALKNGDGDGALKLLEDALVTAAGGEAPPAPEGGGEALAETPDAPKDEEEVKAYVAQLKRLYTLTSCATITSIADQVEELLKLRTKLGEDKKTIELAQRRDLIAELIGMRVEDPATAWEGDPKDRVPCERLSVEPIEKMRERVRQLRASRGGAPPKPPAGPSADGGRVVHTPHGAVTLSARELRFCEEHGAKPETYAANKAIQEAARNRG